MCQVIVTSRSLFWTLATIVSTLAVLAAVITPKWLVGEPRKEGLRSAKDIDPMMTTTDAEDMFSPSLGIYNRCTRINGRDQCGPFVTRRDMNTEEYPDTWKASLAFFSIGLILMAVTVFSSTLSCCVQSVFKKSIFTLSGTVQAAAGLFYIFGLVLYPAGWGSLRVQRVCGEDAAPFFVANCNLGWAFYSAVGGILGAFLCAVLSIQADVSTSSDKVQDEILEGKSLICLA